MSKALYLEDSYLKEFESTVKSVKDGKYVILEESAFYPSSGGQQHDTGKMIKGAEEFNVVYVGKFSGEISHEVDKEGLKEGDKVKCIIDWDRRYKLMRMHTAAHVLAEAIYRKTKGLTTGNQLDLEQSRIDSNIGEFDQEIIKQCVNDVNEVIKQNLEVSAVFMARAEAMKIENLTKLVKGLPEGIKTVRIIKVGDYDRQADGGCHVKNTSEIGEIEFVKAENKGKNNRRIYFRLK